MNGGVSLTITPLLSMGADQQAKIELKAKQTAGKVVSIHLDEIQALADQNAIILMIKALPADRHTMVILFSSPQAFVNKKSPWSELVDKLIKNDHLSMVCIDELHLFTHFVMTFRNKFKELTMFLLYKLKFIGSASKMKTKIPILFMTASCTKSVVDVASTIPGLTFDTSVTVFGLRLLR
jgi:superfamily II DNA helicase RecQ